MELSNLSTEFFVRKLNDSDIDAIYNLSMGNTIFYRYHPPFVTKESIREGMLALPPNKGYEDKFYIGFFKNDKLTAIMDLICGYPDDDVLFIGLFMMDPTLQGRGIGTKIISECCDYWKKLKYCKVRLGVDKGNPQSDAFWRKNNFTRVSAEASNETNDLIPMERTL